MAFDGEDAGRWALVTSPTRQPADDYLTLSPQGPFIDTGIDINHDKLRQGRIYLSVDTIKEMAEVAGLFGEAPTPAEVVQHETDIYNRGLKDGLLKGENLGRNVLDLLSRLGLTPTVVPSAELLLAEIANETAATGTRAPEDASDRVQQSDGDDSSDVQEPTVGSGDAGGTASAADGVERPDDVPSPLSDDELYRI